jgi:hypothetical protein
VGYAAGSMNLYGYASADPISGSDPMGLTSAPASSALSPGGRFDLNGNTMPVGTVGSPILPEQPMSLSGVAPGSQSMNIIAEPLPAGLLPDTGRIYLMPGGGTLQITTVANAPVVNAGVPKSLSFIVYSEGQNLSTAWWVSAQPSRLAGTKVVGASSVGDAVDQIFKGLGPKDTIGSIEFWAHGNSGLVGFGASGSILDSMDFDPKSRTVDGSDYDSLLKLKGRLDSKATIYYRSCSSFADDKGLQFAKDSANFFGCSVSGHITDIGFPIQPGLRTMNPGAKSLSGNGSRLTIIEEREVRMVEDQKRIVEKF